ncbi:MAG: hypothetical protein QOD93_4862 [Acetobacteraceae bacterium]|jgi:hypothetical protein|nr:hypothetical protein [Acetobacteraceae bacterium]
MPGSIPGNGGTLHVVGMGNSRIGMHSTTPSPPFGACFGVPLDFSMSRQTGDTVKIPAGLPKRFVETLCLAA